MNGEEILARLQEESAANGVSDIHFSPQKENVRVEWRLHGVLEPLGTMEHSAFTDVLRRVKFVAKLKLNLTSIPQDGQYTFGAGTGEKKRTVNVRVATLPSRFGEAVTLRLLDPQRGIISLERLGFPESIATTLKELAKLPNGLVLVTGPTGSGKTTTLYALLSCLIGTARNIITLEDPVEYELPGIIQSEVDPDHDYTFASGLRSILRHDPNVILVGEIRDLETAQTAVNAALTGHLVLSTLHTNSAIEAIPRFLSMGVSPYTFAPALRAILAQRLIRTLSDKCTAADSPCDPLAHETYGGQMSLPELLVVSPAIRGLILSLEQAAVIEAEARKEGFKSMKEWGEELVRGKKTTREEMERVTG